jgi:beta-barrel assembly-enhancing protease
LADIFVTLDQAQWQALRSSCAKDSKVAKFWGKPC